MPTIYCSECHAKVTMHADCNFAHSRGYRLPGGKHMTDYGGHVTQSNGRLTEDQAFILVHISHDEPDATRTASGWIREERNAAC